MRMRRSTLQPEEQLALDGALEEGLSVLSAETAEAQRQLLAATAIVNCLCVFSGRAMAPAFLDTTIFIETKSFAPSATAQVKRLRSMPSTAWTANLAHGDSQQARAQKASLRAADGCMQQDQHNGRR